MRRGLVSSRTAGQEAIEAGLVTVDGAPAFKSSTEVAPWESITLQEPPRRYVSRGGDKLEHGLEALGVDPTDRRCLDAGASTGGFTDCLLQHGAAHVLAYDVGYGQLHPSLRDDDRVTVFERTNIRHVEPGDVPGPPPDLIVCDVSFIGLSVVLPVLRELGADDAEALVLVKPQFEAGREDVGKGGVVRDPDVWQRVLEEVGELAASLGWTGFATVASPLTGAAGNVEFLVRLRVAADTDRAHRRERIREAVAAGRSLRENQGAISGGDRHGGGNA